MKPPLIHPIPAAIVLLSSALAALGAVEPAKAVEWVPFANTGMLMLAVGWGARELWKMRHEVSALPGELRREIEIAVTKSAIRMDVEMGEIEARLMDQVTTLEERFDKHVDNGRD